MMNFKLAFAAVTALLYTSNVVAQTTADPWKQCGGMSWYGPTGEPVSRVCDSEADRGVQ